MSRRGENIYKRSDGRWQAKVLKGVDKNNKKQYKYIYARSYKEVKEKKIQYYKDNPIVNVTSELLFSDLVSKWLEDSKRDFKESTYSRYCFLLKKHILPEFGNYRLDEITSASIDKFIQCKVESGKSNKYINDILSIIKIILVYGVKNNYLGSNTIEIRYLKRNPNEIKILTNSDQRKIVDKVLNEKETYMIGIIMGLYAGLRIGEVCALQWKDIDIVEKTIHISQTINRIQDTDANSVQKTKVIFSDPKTTNSTRFIPISDNLSNWLNIQKREDDDYVLSGTHKYIEPRIFYSKYQAFLQDLHMEKYNFHALRHTFATRCIENSFDVKSLSEILGHSDVNTTLRRYVHPTMAMKRQQIERLRFPINSHEKMSKN